MWNRPSLSIPSLQLNELWIGTSYDDISTWSSKKAPEKPAPPCIIFLHHTLHFSASITPIPTALLLTYVWRNTPRHRNYICTILSFPLRLGSSRTKTHACFTLVYIPPTPKARLCAQGIKQLDETSRQWGAAQEQSRSPSMMVADRTHFHRGQSHTYGSPVTAHKATY